MTQVTNYTAVNMHDVSQANENNNNNNGASGVRTCCEYAGKAVKAVGNVIFWTSFAGATATAFGFGVKSSMSSYNQCNLSAVPEGATATCNKHLAPPTYNQTATATTAPPTTNPPPITQSYISSFQENYLNQLYLNNTAKMPSISISTTRSDTTATNQGSCLVKYDTRLTPTANEKVKILKLKDEGACKLQSMNRQHFDGTYTNNNIYTAGSGATCHIHVIRDGANNRPDDSCKSKESSWNAFKSKLVSAVDSSAKAMLSNGETNRVKIVNQLTKEIGNIYESADNAGLPIKKTIQDTAISALGLTNTTGINLIPNKPLPTPPPTPAPTTTTAPPTTINPDLIRNGTFDRALLDGEVCLQFRNPVIENERVTVNGTNLEAYKTGLDDELDRMINIFKRRNNAGEGSIVPASQMKERIAEFVRNAQTSIGDELKKPQLADTDLYSHFNDSLYYKMHNEYPAESYGVDEAFSPYVPSVINDIKGWFFGLKDKVLSNFDTEKWCYKKDEGATESQVYHRSVGATGMVLGGIGSGVMLSKLVSACKTGASATAGAIADSARQTRANRQPEIHTIGDTTVTFRRGQAVIETHVNGETTSRVVDPELARVMLSINSGDSQVVELRTDNDSDGESVPLTALRPTPTEQPPTYEESEEESALTRSRLPSLNRSDFINVSWEGGTTGASDSATADTGV